MSLRIGTPFLVWSGSIGTGEPGHDDIFSVYYNRDSCERNASRATLMADGEVPDVPG